MTEEIFVEPGEAADFVFRLSMAALSASGPFSSYPGTDRTLVLLEGNSVELNEEALPLLSPVSFPGEKEIFATVTAPGLDFNLMCRRGRASGSIEVCRGSLTLAADRKWTLIFALSEVTVGSLRLGKYDACIPEGSDGVVTITGGAFLRVSVRQLPVSR